MVRPSLERMRDTGYIIFEEKRYNWVCEHDKRNSAWGIDGKKVTRVTVTSEGRLCGTKNRDYAGMPSEPFVATLMEALIERFNDEDY